MTTSQFLGVHAAGIVFGGTIECARVFQHHDPGVEKVILAAWTFFAFLSGAMTEWHPEVVLLIWYMVLIDAVEFTNACVRLHEKSILSPHKRMEQWMTRDLRAVAILWFPCRSLLFLFAPQFLYNHVNTWVLELTLFAIINYATLVCMTGTEKDGCEISASCHHAVSMLIWAGLLVWHGWTIRKYISALDWSWMHSIFSLLIGGVAK